jgi:hypothetical protein
VKRRDSASVSAPYPSLLIRRLCRAHLLASYFVVDLPKHCSLVRSRVAALSVGWRPKSGQLGQLSGCQRQVRKTGATSVASQRCLRWRTWVIVHVIYTLLYG